MANSWSILRRQTPRVTDRVAEEDRGIGEEMSEGHTAPGQSRDCGDGELLGVLYEAANAVRGALAEVSDPTRMTARPGHYEIDVVADEAARAVLLGAGLSVLSEESGLSEAPSAVARRCLPTEAMPADHGPWCAILDPVDGSTNAAHGIPFFSTSICVVDSQGPRVGVVVNQVTGARYEAVRGRGARLDGRMLRASSCTSLSRAVVSLNGFPRRHLGWGQFRAFGCASLELCAVAEGSLDAYGVVGEARLYPWDYLAGVLLCREAGAVVADANDDELVVCDSVPRAPVAAATPKLLAAWLAATREEAPVLSAEPLPK